jgi:uncharacterized cupredoxin-like copper-binding protein
MYRPLVVAAAGAALLAACTSKEAAKPDSAKVAQTGAAGASSYDPATRTATVHAKDFAFVSAPDTLPAGWTTFHFVNDGQTLHHMQIVRLDSGKTASDFSAAMSKGPPPAWVVFKGGPNAPNPGAFSHGAVNLEPGNYVMLCFVDIPDHVAHLTKGMIRPFTVVASSAAGTEPASDATIALSDYTFTVTGLKAGSHTFKVTNNGPQPHEVEIVRFAPGKSMKDLAAWATTFQGPPPGDAIGGVVILMSGGSATFTADLTPGNYGFLCFVPDAKDGKPHMQHGMAKEFKVD